MPPRSSKPAGGKGRQTIPIVDKKSGYSLMEPRVDKDEQSLCVLFLAGSISPIYSNHVSLIRRHFGISEQGATHILSIAKDTVSVSLGQYPQKVAQDRIVNINAVLEAQGMPKLNFFTVRSPF